MTKETSSGRTPFSLFYRYPQLKLGLISIGSLGFLSSSLVVAQTDTSIVTGSASLKITPAEHEIAAPPISTPEPAIRHKPTAPEPIVQSTAPASQPLRESAPAVSTKPDVGTSSFASELSKKPAASVRAPEESAPTLPAPNLSLPDTASVAKPPRVILNPAQIQQSSKTPVEPTNNYIDSTDYSIGATARYQAPTAVVLTERSTGCQTVSQNGKLSSGICGVATPSQQTASKPTSTVPTLAQLVASQKTPTPPTLAQLVASQKPPTLPTANSGNTSQEPQLTGVLRLPRPPVAAGVGSSNPGFLQLADSGSRATQRTPYSEYSAAPIPVLPGQSYYSSAAPSTAPMGLDYYNLTTRPGGRPNIGQSKFIFPLTIPAAITSLFGWRVHPISGDYRFHAGTDLGAPAGTPVIAAVSGQVVTADFVGGYGLTVILQHEKGTQESLYAHLSEIFVQPGQQVEQGTVIGRVGSTGNSTGPHLHFEWRHLTPDGWVAVDARAHLEYALAQFIRALQIAQASPQRGT